MKEFFHHFFVPRESNNHRAKLLHNQTIFFFVVLVVVSQFVLSVTKTHYSQVLGTTTDITTEELLLLTNEKRQAIGLSALILNDDLSEAARLKADYMFNKNYWAHNAPDGTTPWVFIKKVDYDYMYAGENLARGFTTSSDVVNAWMASQSHKENMLSTNYKDIGFAVMEGKLLGENTTVVVEMFGSKDTKVADSETRQNIPSEARKVTVIVPEIAPLGVAVNKVPVVDSVFLSRNMGVGIILLFIVVFVIDMIIIERKKIIRFVGHNIDHIIFLTGMAILILFIGNGIVL